MEKFTLFGNFRYRIHTPVLTRNKGSSQTLLKRNAYLQISSMPAGIVTDLRVTNILVHTLFNANSEIPTLSYGVSDPYFSKAFTRNTSITTRDQLCPNVIRTRSQLRITASHEQLVYKKSKAHLLWQLTRFICWDTSEVLGRYGSMAYLFTIRYIPSSCSLHSYSQFTITKPWKKILIRK